MPPLIRGQGLYVNIYTDINILQGHSYEPVVRPHNQSKVSLYMCRTNCVLLCKVISMCSMLVLGGLMLVLWGLRNPSRKFRKML